MNNDIAIKVENLSKVFPLRQPQEDENGNLVHEHWALKDVSFEIKKGESVGIIGPNGSGKSTLLKILAGVTKPTSGKITIKGKVASILDIGAGFHPELSGRENVFLNGQIHGFSKKEIEAKFDEIVAFSGIEKFINEPVKNYSNGMYLRLAFSIMAHLDFDVYLFDEVLSVGDAKFNLIAQKQLSQLRHKNKTIIFVSHNLQEIENQNIFFLLEKGVLKNFSHKKNILSDYIETSIMKDEQKSDSSTLNGIGTITHHPSFKTSPDIEINQISLIQDNSTDTLRSDWPIQFEIDYTKKRDDATIDIFLVLSNYKGSPFLLTSPFIGNELNTFREKNRFVYKCTIPPNFLNSQLYFVSIFFYKNCNQFFEKMNSQIDSSSIINDSTIEIAMVLQNIIMFKTLLIHKGKEIDLSSFNLASDLFVKLKWDSNVE